MTDGPIMRGVRESAARLVRTAAQQGELLRASRAAHADVELRARAALRAATEAAEGEHARATRQARREHADESEALAVWARQRAALAGRATESSRAAAEERFESERNAVRKHVGDESWMADTVLDTERSRARQQHAQSAEIVRAARAELALVRQRLAVAAQGAGVARAVGPSDGPAQRKAGAPPEPPEPPEPANADGHAEGPAQAGPDDLEAVLTALAQRTGQAAAEAAALERAVLARATRALPGATIAACVGLAAGVGGWFMGRGDAATASAAGAGLGASVLAAAGLWGIGRGARRRAAGRLQRGVALLAEVAALIERAATQAEARLAKRIEQATLTHIRAGEKAAELSAAARDSALRRRQKAMLEIEAQRSAAVSATESEREQRRQRIESRLAERLAEADDARSRELARAAHEHDDAILRARQALDAQTAESEREWAQARDASGAVIAQAEHLAELSCPAWESVDWSGAQPAAGPGRDWSVPQSPPALVRIGKVPLGSHGLGQGAPGDAVSLTAPVGLELPDHASLLIQYAGAGKGSAVDGAREAALEGLRGAMLRVLTAFPPGTVRFALFDPVGLGQSFAGFMHLADYSELLVSDRIWTEPRHIEQKLTDLTEHMEQVIQKYLRNQFATMEAYNKAAGEIAEPYRFLVVADFPAGFTEASCKRLASVVTSGPRCGVYTMIAQDTRVAVPAGLTAADLRRGAVRVVWKRDPDGAGSMRVDAPELAGAAAELERPPEGEAFNAIVRAAGERAGQAGRVRVPFETVAPGPERWWSLKSDGELRVPLGRAGATRLLHMTLGRGTAQHALIAGRTGSGKSTLLHVMITGCLDWYAPDQVELYLVDFKKGVEFKAYAGGGLPHVRVVAIESEREFGVSVLRGLDEELRRRGELYRAAGVQDLAGYRRAAPDQPMPRVLLVIDEFQELFVEDDRLAQEAGLLLDRLVRQGRAFGMHAVLGSQTLGGAYSLARATMGQMAVRIALQCSEADAVLIMGDDNTAPRLLTRPGEAIYNDASGAVEGNSPFQVAWLPDQTRDAVLEAVALRAVDSAGGGAGGGAGGAARTIVFEGNAPALLENAAELNTALASEPEAQPAAAGGVPARPARIWLGEPVAIKERTSAPLRRQAGGNLLVVGQREETAAALSAAALASLACAPGARVWLLDGTPADSAVAGVLPGLAGAMVGVAQAVGYRDAAGAIERMAAETRRRLSAEDLAVGNGHGRAQPPPPWALLVHGLHRFRALRRAENEFDFSSSADDKAPPADRLLAEVLREGPAVGVHVVAWVDTAANLTRWMERSLLREFDARVLMQMSAADSSALIDAPTAASLGAGRALLFSEEAGVVEKFRPFALPGAAWLAWAGERAAARAASLRP